jgi:hypothetical protein
MEMILVFKQQELQLVKEIEFFLSLIGKRDWILFCMIILLIIRYYPFLWILLPFWYHSFDILAQRINCCVWLSCLICCLEDVMIICTTYDYWWSYIWTNIIFIFSDLFKWWSISSLV